MKNMLLKLKYTCKKNLLKYIKRIHQNIMYSV